MDQGVKQMLKMIEDDGASLAKKAELCKQTRPDLIAQIEEFYCIRQSLAERYDYLTTELQKSIPSDFQVQGAVDSESGDCLNTPGLTPEQKLGFKKSSHRVASVSSHGASSDISFKEGSESSSSSSDSDSESFNSSGNAYFSLPINTDRNGFHEKILELGTDLPSIEGKLQVHAEDHGDSGLNAEDGHYENILGRLMQSEEELRVSKIKLKLSEDKVTGLKSELEKSECLVVLVGTLQAQFEAAQIDVKMKVADLEIERRRVLELRKQIAECTQDFQSQLHLAGEEMTILKAKLDSQSGQVLDLQERIVLYEKDLSDRDQEIRRLNVALHDAKEKFSWEEATLRSDIFALTEQQHLLEERLEEWELQGQTLEDKLRQSDAEKMDIKRLHDDQQIGMQGEISRLKVEVIERCGHVEVLNKNFDSLKYKYDLLMSEKDGMHAKVNTLVAELSSKDNQIRQLEVHLRILQTEHGELIAGSENAKNRVDELRLKVVELEKEVDRQRQEISAGAEEKREAIRQLCFSLEHYRSGYKELRQAFIGHRRVALMAS